MREPSTNQLHGILDPLTNDILLTRAFETHEEMLYPALLFDGNLVCEDVYSRVDLHGICVDDAGAPVSAIPIMLIVLRERKRKLDSELRLSDAGGTTYRDKRAERHRL